MLLSESGSSITRGREYEGLTPSQLSIASTVVALRAEPLPERYPTTKDYFNLATGLLAKRLVWLPEQVMSLCITYCLCEDY